MSFGSALARAWQGFSSEDRNLRLSSAATASRWIRLDRLRNGGRYEDLACSRTATMFATPEVSSCSRIPPRSTLRDRQNSISARGPASSPSSELSWLLTTSLICRVQWMSVDSSRCTRSFSRATAWASDTSSPGMYKTVFPLRECTDSVRLAMNLCTWAVKSFRTLSGQEVLLMIMST